jgi:hypothetical protein
MSSLNRLELKDAKERAEALSEEITSLLEENDIDYHEEGGDEGRYISFTLPYDPSNICMILLRYGNRTVIRFALSTRSPVLPISLDNLKLLLENLLKEKDEVPTI